MQKENDMKADRMSHAGEWPETERRNNERRGGTPSALRAEPAVTDALHVAVLHALDVAESSLDYRPEFRRAMSSLHTALAQSQRAGAANGGNTKPESAAAASSAVLPVTDSLDTNLIRHMLLNALAESATGVGSYRQNYDADRLAAKIEAIGESLPVASPVAGWVSVKERKPNDGEIVIVALDNGTVTTGSWGWIGVNDGDCYATATHWMPLPPAPAATPTQQEQS